MDGVYEVGLQAKKSKGGGRARINHSTSFTKKKRPVLK